MKRNRFCKIVVMCPKRCRRLDKSRRREHDEASDRRADAPKGRLEVPDRDEEDIDMKKTILHRSVFAVVACIALAASVLLTSVRVIPVQMNADIRAMLTPEAETAFCEFHENLQVWYQETPVTAEGVTLTPEGGYDRLMEIVLGLDPYMAACGAVTDEADLAQLQQYNEPMSVFLMVALNLMYNVSGTGSYTFAVEEWTELGGLIEAMASSYQG